MNAEALGGVAAQVHIMGVINTTPDSFSDGGAYLDPLHALARAEELVAAGADYIDIGAESTRPGAAPVSMDEEWARLKPVLEPLCNSGINARISVDTRKPEIMRRAANLGVGMINDVQGNTDFATLQDLASRPGMKILVMHMHGNPQTMQKAPLRGPVAVQVVDRFFKNTHKKLLDAGFGHSQIWLDPGIGFGKTDAGNVQLMQQIPHWSAHYHLAVGISRKSLIGRTLGIENPDQRDGPSKMLELGLIAAGARLIRTHDVARLKGLVDLLSAEHQD